MVPTSCGGVDLGDVLSIDFHVTRRNKDASWPLSYLQRAWEHVVIWHEPLLIFCLLLSGSIDFCVFCFPSSFGHRQHENLLW